MLFILAFAKCSNQKSRGIKIGVILPMTGNMANYGKSSQAALLSELDIINKERKEKDYPLLELIIEDDQMEVKGGINAITKLIQKDKVPAIIGPDASSITLGVAPIAESNGTVLISPGSTSSDVTKAGDYIFRTILSGEYESKVSAKLYKNLYNGKKLGVMYINNEYGNSLKRNFIINLGYDSTVLLIPYSDKETNFSSYLTKLKSNNIEVVYIVGYNEMIQIFQQAKRINLNVKWLGATQLSAQSLIDKIGPSAEGTIFPSAEGNIEEIKKGNKEFYDIFLNRSGGLELDAFAANAVDALKILDLVIGKNSEISSTQIKDELYKIKNFKGIAGPISFDSNGDVYKELDIKIIKGGKITHMADSL